MTVFEDLKWRGLIKDISSPELEERLKAFEQAVETAEVKQIAQSDIDFHDLIYTAAENPRLVVLLNNLREQIYRYRVEYLKDEKNYPRLIEEHRQIMQGLKESNEQYVVEMTKKHMDNQAVAVRNIIRSGKYDQLYNIMEAGVGEGMQTMTLAEDKLRRSNLLKKNVVIGSKAG